ncbi:MAG TPA: hypothetical protein VEM93_09975 [Actinomycetota bacterium]|nr:hypothetical protein [Actinomycetota bacterium]
MSKLRFQLAVSLDGFVAGPDQSQENPLGVGGLELHGWVFELEAWRRQQGQEGGLVNASTPVVEEAQSNVGAVVMGRNMFGGEPGPWRLEQVRAIEAPSVTHIKYRVVKWTNYLRQSP